MKAMLGICLMALAASVAAAQQSAKPPLRRGVHVQMASASHAVETSAADEPNATVVGLTVEGKMFLGDKPIDVKALSSLPQGTVYVKADARVPFEKVLAVLDALNGRSVVLLTAAPTKPEKDKIVPPYGLKLTVGE